MAKNVKDESTENKAAEEVKTAAPMTQAEIDAYFEAKKAELDEYFAKREQEAPVLPAAPKLDSAAEEQANDEAWRQMEEIFIYDDGVTNSGDVYVSVNGRRYLIKRGVRTRVPAPVAAIVRESERLRAVARERSDKLGENASW